MNPRSEQLHHLARSYVTEALGKDDFDAIPYAADVSLRAPLWPGGSAVPLTGRTNLRQQFLRSPSRHESPLAKRMNSDFNTILARSRVALAQTQYATIR